jgi:DNA-binding response OmpR family regulator
MQRILIIEDELPMQMALVDSLEDAGYKTLTASDGESGLERALEERPDLILLDIMLPRLDGLSVCAELRHRGMQSPVLMLTAKDGVDDRVTGLDAGGDDYLAKPFRVRELLARVRALLRRCEPVTETPASAESSSPLSEREQEVLEHLARGYLYKEIATALELEETTIRTYVRRIYQKLDVHSRAQAVAVYSGHKLKRN